jgi:hypothetical protein
VRGLLKTFQPQSTPPPRNSAGGDPSHLLAPQYGLSHDASVWTGRLYIPFREGIESEEVRGVEVRGVEG